MPLSKVVIVQWAPEFHDPGAGVRKAERAIAEAGERGASLVVFPETWLQGYPYWASLSVRDPRFAWFRRDLFANAIELDGAEVGALRKAAAGAGCTVVIGVHERAGGTIHNTQLFIGSDGSLLGAHRKLVPTTTERLVWGMGDGSDIAAYDTPVGRLGGLICFEHMMPLARYALCSLGVQVHAGVWHGHPVIDGWLDACTRQLAFENGCFVVVARECMSVDRLSHRFPDMSDEPGRWFAHGGSAVISPDGKYLAGPVFDSETLLEAEIDLGAIADTKWWYDGVGHYSRPDVFSLRWDRSQKLPVRDADEDIDITKAFHRFP
ncbi:MAG: carbon-nitrogen hydrolase family protein [Gammaproteobacteria bacterium]